ncbi:hypothetical protein [Amycolatopsis sp. GA6-003]|uniref:hypothetical protein n=1 Tax=Amycolatopsis sp. GA6-003 TaxID=2652444 RepID=UPI003917094D
MMQALAFGWSDRLIDHTPQVLGSSSIHEDTVRTVAGTLYWDGHHVPNLRKLVRTVYPGLVQRRTAHHGGVAWQRDRELLELLGLRYLLLDTVIEGAR